MLQDRSITRANLKTPKAAAIAGILFSLLLIAVFWLLRVSVPADPQEPGSWLRANSNVVALALNLVPFAGIAFLWFIGSELSVGLKPGKDFSFDSIADGKSVIGFGDLICSSHASIM